MPRKDAQPGAKEVAQDRRAKALDLRKAGLSYRAIGTQLGVSEKTAHQDVQREVQRIAARNSESAAELRALELERLDYYAARIAQQVAQGHLGALDRALRISERRAKLLGLDAPMRNEHTGADGGPIEVHDARSILRQRLAGRLQSSDAE